MKYYAGIGSRSVTPEAQEWMTYLAGVMERKGYILRSGGAAGSDIAFEEGCKGTKEIYLPWDGFKPYPNVLNSPKRTVKEPGVFVITDPVIVARATAIAQQFHPTWSYLTQGMRNLMIRNTYQVLGPQADRSTISDLVICCANVDSKGVQGGTGQAVRIAKAYGIPVFNISQEGEIDRLRGYLRDLR